MRSDLMLLKIFLMVSVNTGHIQSVTSVLSVGTSSAATELESASITDSLFHTAIRLKAANENQT